MFKKLLTASRFTVIIAVISLLTASIALMVNGAYKVFKIIISIFQGKINDKDVLVGFIESADLFLLAVALYIIAIGLYDLFIDPNIEMPEWLNIQELSDLKKKLLDVVIVILGVIFLGKVAKWGGGQEILYLGGGIALMIAALTFFGKADKK